MAPFAKPKTRLLDRLLTLRSLHLGHYYVDTNRAIDDMAKRGSGDFDATCEYILPNETLADARHVAKNSEEYIQSSINYINAESTLIMNETINLADIAFQTKWRLSYDAIFAGIFAVVGLVAATRKKKSFAVISFCASLVSACSFIDELDIRSDELNFEFDKLTDHCQSVARSLLELATDRANHNFFVDAMKKRFGDAFTHGTDDPDELNEPYDPGYAPPTH